ncbi:TonB-dependent receptor [uncultured Parasphingorhabdus sp.]|uniref:TonB-dependent receptor n=1 Tax=uncultured Parasphingorhabdus sp. TaxID=2709694 RepID=UPI002AA8CE45|nr:TonB-dependent receptor [uncultured Parasphingorhabdus sp.]
MRKIFHSSVALAALTLPMTAYAQDSDAEDSIIIVTAQGREQALQEVPVAVSAFNGELLEQARITDVTSLQTATPSLAVVTSNRPGTSTSISLRGLGTSGNDPGLEAAVGFSVDGVYRSRSGAGLGDFVDTAGLEILRGPQGTLFGKNTTAGVISVTTRRPDLYDFDGFMEGTVGNYDLLRFRGAANLPLSEDKVAARFSFGYQSRDGFVKDPLRNTSYNDRDRFTFSGKFLFQITDDIEALIIGDYSEADESCCQSVRFTNDSVALAGILDGFASSIGASYPNPPTPTERVTSVNSPVLNANKDRGIQLQLKANLGAAELTSITAYRSFDDKQDGDVDFSGADLLSQQINFGIDAFSQELRLKGEALDGRLDWLVGGFYSDESIEYDESIGLGVHLDPYATILSAGLAGLYPAQANAFGTMANQDAESFALFTHNIFEVADGLKLTAGLRWTKETKQATGNPFANGTTGGNDFLSIIRAAIDPLTSRANSFDRRVSDSAFSGTAAISYEWTPDFMTYASYSRGFKAGGFALGRASAGPAFSTNPVCSASGNVALTSPPAPFVVYQCDPANPEFKPETVNSYELGLRSQFWDRRVTFNLTAFRSDINNLQVNSFVGTGFFVTNAGTARSQGIELESVVKIVPGVSIGGNVSYLEALYGDNVGVIASGEPSVSGEPLNAAPEWSGSVFANLDLPVSDEVSFFARPELYFRSSIKTSSRVATDGSPLTLAGYELLNVSAGIRVDDRFEVSAFCRNCTDKTYNGLIFNSVFQGASRDSFLGDPAEYGVSIRFDW